MASTLPAEPLAAPQASAAMGETPPAPDPHEKTSATAAGAERNRRAGRA
ncbi:MAG: hypothetical protein ACK5N0_00590 [Synechococcaceae cyanobacterium]